MFLDGAFECYTLEDRVRTGPKVYGETAIPTGQYQILITPSPRFKRMLPLLIDVPGFDGVRIHPGNTHKDTEGCILVGQRIEGDELRESKLAFDALYSKLDPPMWMHIEGSP